MNSTEKELLLKSIKRSLLLLSLLCGLGMTAFTSAGFLMITSKPVAIESHGVKDNQFSHVKIEIADPDPVKTISSDYVLKKGISKAERNEVAVSKTKTEISEANQPAKNNQDMVSPKAESDKELTEGMVDLGFELKCIEEQPCLVWKTDLNSSVIFELQSSTDNTVYNVTANNTKVSELEYERYYLASISGDADLKTTFRLRMKSENGSEMFSAPVAFRYCNPLDEGPEIDVFPVGYGSFKITVLADTSEEFKVTLTDLNEIEIVNESFVVEPGENEYVIESESLPRGIYNLKVTNGRVLEEKTITLK